MARNTLETCIDGIRSVWGPLSTEVVAACQARLEALVQAPTHEDWLAELHRQAQRRNMLLGAIAALLAGLLAVQILSRTGLF